MDFRELLLTTDGGASQERLARALQLTANKTQSLLDAASSYLIDALQTQASTVSGKYHLRRLIISGGPQQFIDKPGLLEANVAEIEGRSFLRHLFASDEAIERLEKSLCASLELDPKTVQRALPLLTCIFVGAICKRIASQLQD